MQALQGSGQNFPLLTYDDGLVQAESSESPLVESRLDGEDPIRSLSLNAMSVGDS
jgi:hypothetical protein